MMAWTSIASLLERLITKSNKEMLMQFMLSNSETLFTMAMYFFSRIPEFNSQSLGIRILSSSCILLVVGLRMMMYL
jgi:hypothetical protein